MTSSTRIPITKDRDRGPIAEAAPQPKINQDSIAAAERARQAAERARQDAIAAAERAHQDSLARAEQTRRDAVAAAERRRQDSIAAVAAEQARLDSMARADSVERRVARASRRIKWAGGFYAGIAGGMNMPMGDMKLAATDNGGYASGFNVTVPIGFDISGTPFGLRVDGSFDQLKGNSYVSGGNTIAGTAISIGSVNADLKLRVPLGRTYSRFYLLGGGTYSSLFGYSTTPTTGGAPLSPSNATRKFGWNAGGGLTFAWGRTGLFLESRYMNVPQDATVGYPYTTSNWVPIILGIQF